MSQFKVGQRVKCIANHFSNIKFNVIYKVIRINGRLIWVETDKRTTGAYSYTFFMPYQNMEERTK